MEEESYQITVGKQMENELIKISADVNDVQCMALECKRCVFYVSGACMLNQVRITLLKCFDNK